MRPRVSILALAPLLAAALASFGVVGADARWLSAVNGRGAPIRFATAPTGGWHNAPALGEVVFHALYAVLADRGLILAQVCAALIGLAALARGLRAEGATPGGAAAVSLLVIVGSLPAIVVVRNSLFSLALFPVLLLLLEREQRAPSRRAWLALPLLVLWANLHGGVLVGYALLGAFAVGSWRRRPLEAAGLLAGGAVAVCATRELWHTPQYYAGVARNEAARMGVGLWAPLGAGVFDIALVAVAVLLLALAVRKRPPWRAWEVVAALGLAAGTVHAARLGTWLLFVLAYPAARALRIERPELPVAVAALLAVVAVAGLVHAPFDAGSRALAARAARSGGPVLAEGVLAEQVVVAGGRVWIADPIDAFRRSDQRLFLHWLDGQPDGRAAVRHARWVLVRRTSAAGRAAAVDSRLRRVASARSAVLYAVSPAR